MSLVNNSVLSSDIDKIIAECDVVHISTVESLTYATVVADSMASFAPTLTKEVYAGTGGGFALKLAASSNEITKAGDAVALSFVDSSGTVLYVDSGTPNTYAIGDTANISETIIYVSADITDL